MSEYAFKPALWWAAQIQHRNFSCVEALTYFLDRGARFNPSLNAIVALRAEAALESAREADKALSKGVSWGALHGVPMTVKESFDVKGLPTTWGDPANADVVADTNAASVQRLVAQGAIIFGKSNVPTMLADWQTFNPLYGTTNNPWDLARTPGGSSGGAAAALAAGLTTLELGSDIGASIRNPAHYCGVFGHKPTFGVVPQTGHGAGRANTPLDLIVCGPLARTAEDLAAALDILVAPEPSEAHWAISLPRSRIQTLNGARVAVWVDDEQCAVDEQVRRAVVRVADALERAGAQLDWGARPFPDSRKAHELYIRMLRAATGALLADADYGALAALSADLPEADPSYLAWNARFATQSHRSWFDGHRARAELQARWKEFFRDFDVVLCPVASTTAFPHDQQTPRVERKIQVNGGSQDYNDQLFWAGLATLGYLPATVVPAGRSEQGLPVGVQIIGAYGQDRTTIEFARLLSEEIGGFVPPAAFV